MAKLKYLAKPTAKLPNRRIIADEQFISDLVDAVNLLNMGVTELNKRLDGLGEHVDEEVGTLKKAASDEAYVRSEACKTLAEGIDKANTAIAKIANATNIILGGTEQ